MVSSQVTHGCHPGLTSEDILAAHPGRVAPDLEGVLQWGVEGRHGWGFILTLENLATQAPECHPWRGNRSLLQAFMDAQN